jgi:hypothetical protein
MSRPRGGHIWESVVEPKVGSEGSGVEVVDSVVEVVDSAVEVVDSMVDLAAEVA